MTKNVKLETKVLPISHPSVITSVTSLLHVFLEWLLLIGSPKRLFQFISPPTVFEYFPHTKHTSYSHVWLHPVLTVLWVGSVVLILPLSFREQPRIPSDHHRALPDPLRAHSQDHQSGVEPTSWWKAGLCFLWWHSSGTMTSDSVASSLCTLTPLFPQLYTYLLQKGIF